MYAIIDIRGRLLKKFYGSSDNSITKADGTFCPRWESALNDTLEQYVWPIIDSGVPTLNIVAVWDSGNTYRKNLYPDYKQRRLTAEKDAEQRKQENLLFEKTRSFLALLGIKQCWVPGEEADDLIALLCQRLEGPKVVYTGDKDLLALAGEEVLINLDGQLHGGPQGHCLSSPLGVPYSLITLHKALVGDPSDGYGGVPGLGAKGFSGLLERYGEAGLKWFQGHLENNDPKPFEPYLSDAAIKKVYENWPQAHLCWRLAKLAPEACYGEHQGNVKRPLWLVRLPNWERFYSAFEEIHRIGFGETGQHLFEARAQKLRGLFPTERLITNKDAQELQVIMQQVWDSEIVSYDFESYDTLKHAPFQSAAKGGYVDVLSQRITGISVNYGTNNEKTFYASFEHKDTDNLPREWAVWILQVLSQRSRPTVVQNANFELTVAQNDLGFMPAAPHDTAVMISYVNENEESGLKDMSLRVLGHRQMTYAEVTQGRGMNEITAEETLRYGCDDSLCTSHLYSLYRMIMQIEGSWDFYCQNEVMPAVDDAFNYIEGVCIDYDRLRELQVSSEKSKTEAEAEIRRSLEKNLHQTQESVTRAASAVLAEWWDLERFKHEDQERAREHYTKVWNTAWNLCNYRPYSEEVQLSEFTSTPSNINDVIAQIDPSAPKVSKTTAAAIEEYDLELTDYYNSLPENDPKALQLQEFSNRLYAARSNLSPNKRSGQDYDRLREFCQPLFDSSPRRKIKGVGSELNFGSSQQMQAFLYGILGLPIRRRSKVDRGSTRDKLELHGAAATGLKAIATALVFDVIDDSDWRRAVLQNYKTISKEQQLESLYFAKYPLWKHPRDGRIHPGIKNCGTVTRRPSSSNPNILQVAKGPMRTMYIGGQYSGDNEPRVVVSLDFANQELVILASECGDPVMLEAFTSTPRRDIHTVTSLGYAGILLPRLGATKICTDYEGFYSVLHSGTEEKKPYSELRNKYSKACNFLIAYAGGPTTLAENLSISIDLAKQLMERTFSLYERVRPWQAEVSEFARRHGYTETAYGNRRHVTKDIHSRDDGLRKRMERQAINYIIQGGAADILKTVRQKMIEREIRQRYQARMVFPVYDELTASVPISMAQQYAYEMKEIMEVTPPGHPVGMATELSIGFTWGTQKELLWEQKKIQEFLETLTNQDKVAA